MYAWSIGILAASFLYGILRGPGFFFLLFKICLGIFGNQLYYMRVRKIKADNAFLPEHEKARHIIAAGGVNKIAVILLLIIVFLVSCIMAARFYFYYY
jgi:hypothetical protein